MWLPMTQNERDDLLRNPTLEVAKKFWKEAMGDAVPATPDTPLGAVHKARLQWLHSTNKMLRDSTLWLNEHGYATTHFGAPALTPARRDADRVSLGWKPLGNSGE